MFLIRVQLGSYRVGSFWVRVYSDRFLLVRLFQVNEIWIQKILVNFRVGYFLVGFDSNFQVQVKMLRPSVDLRENFLTVGFSFFLLQKNIEHICSSLRGCIESDISEFLEDFK